MNNQCAQLLLNLSRNSLLHLYLTVAEEGRIVPLGKRNTLVLKYLKRQADRPNNKPIKKEIRSLIKIGRNNNNLETTLLELNSVQGEQDKPDRSDAGLTYELFQALEAEHGYAPEFTEFLPSAVRRLSLSKSQFSDCFNDDGQMIAPFKVTTIGITSQALADLVMNTSAPCDVDLELLVMGPEQIGAIEVNAIRGRRVD